MNLYISIDHLFDTELTIIVTGLGRVVSQQSDSRRSYPVSSSQSMLPSYATNMSVDFSPCKTSVANLQTARVLKSQDKRGNITKEIMFFLVEL